MTADQSPNNFRVVVIGAGMSGILAGIKLLEDGITNFVIYEKADRIGGTWRENTYPGLTCDVPPHHYTYSFERNPDWNGRRMSPIAAMDPELENKIAGRWEEYGIGSDYLGDDMREKLTLEQLRKRFPDA